VGNVLANWIIGGTGNDWLDGRGGADKLDTRKNWVVRSGSVLRGLPPMLADHNGHAIGLFPAVVRSV